MKSSKLIAYSHYLFMIFVLFQVQNGSIRGGYNERSMHNFVWV